MKAEYIDMICEFDDNIFTTNEVDFDKIALELYRYQYHHNEVYRQFVNGLQIDAEKVDSIYKIPFLPIGLFKSHTITTKSFLPEYIFESSGTTQIVPSRHHIKKLELYARSFNAGFQLFYGNAADWCIIGLLPSYLERRNSSLVMMVNELVTKSGHPHSGFYLDDHARLAAVLQELETNAQKVLLIGVTFALLDFADVFPMELRHTVVMETGGMKGRRQEMTREEVHNILKSRFGLHEVHSEYGMTELLSQAYSQKNGNFYCPPWLRVFIREEDDPLQVKDGKGPGEQSVVNGILNIIDLANIHSCAFIATEDVGIIHANGSFEVLGRVDNSDVRGCSLMVV
ncbi:MAG: acyl transferase [Chitinophagaceae bacterium]